MSFSFKSLGRTGVNIWGHNTVSTEQVRGGYAQDGLFENGDERFRIRWQDGPVNRDAGEQPNGAFVEDVLEVCKLRLKAYQDSPFSCQENENAISFIEGAIGELNRRMDDRASGGVLGTDKV